jgi:UDP-glucose 4-epimerase
MSVCLVTGGAGFIGSHLVDALVARGDTVKVVDNISSGSLSNLAPIENEIELLIGDLNHADMLEKAVGGVDYVFHLMAPSCETPQAPEFTPGKWAYASDTLNLLVAARQAGVRRVIYTSIRQADRGKPVRRVHAALRFGNGTVEVFRGVWDATVCHDGLRIRHSRHT